MKLSSINNIKGRNIKLDDKKNYNSNSININNALRNTQNNNDVSFTGLTSFLVNFWQWVEMGGRGLSFTIEDMGGTNIPRTIMGMFAGFKYTHKINMDGLKQEGIREFLTGPTMTFMPIAILAVMKKLCHNSVNTHVENLRNLSYFAKDFVDEKGVLDENAFVQKISKDLLENTINKKVENNCGLTKEDVDSLAQTIMKYKEIISDASLNKKQRKQMTNSALEEAQFTFQRIIKKASDSYDGRDFLTAKYSINDTKTGATKFKNYVGYIGDYINDFSAFSKDKIHNLNPEALVNSFKKHYVGMRLITVACMIFITAKLMSYIPKLYTWASGGVNPNAKNIYNEADKIKAGGAK